MILRRFLFVFFLIVVLVGLVECGADGSGSQDQEITDTVKSIRETPYVLGIPAHFPQVSLPEDNMLTVEKVNLGKRLFFDPQLSVDGSVSCASCHHPNRAFSDTVALSSGARNSTTERNSPSLMNVVFHPYLMREGAVPTLEMQVLAPLEGENEMAHNIVLAVKRLQQDTSYQRDFRDAFGTGINTFTLTRAIAAFERTLIGGDSPYDAWVQGDSTALSDQQIAGAKLFFSEELKCGSCHEGVLFSNFKIENNGLYAEYRDPGKYRLTLKEEDKGKFKTPSLRNVAITAPYMHDGSLRTLAEVLDHYASGGQGHPNQSELITGFKLSYKDREDLIAFLESLTEASAMSEDVGFYTP